MELKIFAKYEVTYRGGDKDIILVPRNYDLRDWCSRTTMYIISIRFIELIEASISRETKVDGYTPLYLGHREWVEGEIEYSIVNNMRSLCVDFLTDGPMLDTLAIDYGIIIDPSIIVKATDEDYEED